MKKPNIISRMDSHLRVHLAPKDGFAITVSSGNVQKILMSNVILRGVRNLVFNANLDIIVMKESDNLVDLALSVKEKVRVNCVHPDHSATAVTPSNVRVVRPVTEARTRRRLVNHVSSKNSRPVNVPCVKHVYLQEAVVVIETRVIVAYHASIPEKVVHHSNVEIVQMVTLEMELLAKMSMSARTTTCVTTARVSI